MTQQEKMADANELMDLEMMDTIVGGSSKCSSCSFACSDSCLWGSKNKHDTTPPPTKPTTTDTTSKA